MADFNLPNEIWCMIFSYLPVEAKKNATATCKRWSRLIHEDPKLLPRHILVSWYNMEIALDTLQWKWSNWPALKTLELNKLEGVEDSRVGVQNVIDKLFMYGCPPSLELVLFDVDLTPIRPIPTNGQKILGKDYYILGYQLCTDQIFGLGQKLDSIKKWDVYEYYMNALKIIRSLGSPAFGGQYALLLQFGWTI